jgi:hypothetical protein
VTLLLWLLETRGFEAHGTVLTLGWREEVALVRIPKYNAHACPLRRNYTVIYSDSAYFLFKHSIQTLRSKVSVTNITFHCWHFLHTRSCDCPCLETRFINRFMSYEAIQNQVLKLFADNVFIEVEVTLSR